MQDAEIAHRANIPKPLSDKLLQAKKYELKNTYSNYSSIRTFNETGSVEFPELFDAYDEAYEKAATQAGRLLAGNLQDQTARAGFALAGWNPKHSDMAAQAVEWWSWGK